MLATLVRRSTLNARRASLLVRSAQRGFAAYPPHEVVGLPALSPTMETGTLAKWLKQEGDKISIGDVICQVETDKAVVDFEAQDESYLAKILVKEGTENIVVGAPIMVATEEEENLAGLKDYVLDPSLAVPLVLEPKSPEELPPKKEEVAVDPKLHEPVVPSDFLVSSMTTHKIVPGVTADVIPTPAAPAKPAAAAPKPRASADASVQFAEHWGYGYKQSPLSASLIKKQQAYIDQFGLTGTAPATQ